MASENLYMDLVEDNACDITVFYEGNNPLYGSASDGIRPRTHLQYDRQEDLFYHD